MYLHVDNFARLAFALVKRITGVKWIPTFKSIVPLRKRGNSMSTIL